MFDLSEATVKGTIEDPVDPSTDQTPDPEPSPDPTPDPAPDPDPVPSPDPAPANDFPADKFGGRFKSWDEVEKELSKPKPEPVQYDEFLQKLINKYQTDGTLEDYFKAYSVDYDALSDQDMLKRNFFEQNQGLSDKAKQKLWEKELSKYTIDPDEFSDDEIELGTELMKRDADKLRAEAKEKQKAFLSPQKQSAPQVDLQKLKEQVEALPEVKKLKSERKLSISVDGQNINYELDDPDFAVNSMVDDSNFYGLFTENGKLNPDKWAAVVEFARNPDKILKTVLDQGKTLGRAEIEAEMKNTKLPGTRPAPGSTSGDFKSGLLEAFAQQGKITR